MHVLFRVQNILTDHIVYIKTMIVYKDKYLRICKYLQTLLTGLGSCRYTPWFLGTASRERKLLFCC